MDKTQFSNTKLFEYGAMIASRYKVLDIIGKGGMGLVLKVEDTALSNEVVALKILNSQDQDLDGSSVKRLINEVCLARSLTHQNIVRIHDIGEAEEEGKTYFSMEYVEGKTLADIIDDAENIDFKDALFYLYQISLGLSYAHQKGVIHRDLKPGNILINDFGEVKIADFGLARSLEQDFKLTKTGEVVGTPLYMAPEQFLGHELDHRVDIYSLGIMAFELLSGEHPFPSTVYYELANKHITQPLPSISKINRAIPYYIEDAVNKACSKERDSRYKSVIEFSSDLSQGGNVSFFFFK